MYSVVPFLRVWGFLARYGFSLTVYNFLMKYLDQLKLIPEYNIYQEEDKRGKFEASNTAT
jgi:hypothetical protein